MTALAIIAAISLVAAALGVAIALFWAEDPSPHRKPPTVDGGWRAFS
jgi:hypothetical protein